MEDFSNSYFSIPFKNKVYQYLKPFRSSNDTLASFIVLSTIILYTINLGGISILLLNMKYHQEWWLIVLLFILSLIQCGLYIRVFMIHHDMKHGGFFSKHVPNRMFSYIFGVLCNVSPSAWAKEHNFHHAHSNNLNKNQDGQTAAWTVTQFISASPAQRWLYYLSNTPLLLFIYFFIFMRVKGDIFEALLQLAFYFFLYQLNLLTFFIFSFWVTAIFGFTLFHLQHTFDDVYKAKSDDYDFFTNSMLGSSYWLIPSIPVVTKVIEYFLFGVQYHHIHHLSPQIPAYKLKECHLISEALQLFNETPIVKYRQVIRTLSYGLYNEKNKNFEKLKKYRGYLFQN